MKKITASLILCVFCMCVFAQRQASNWYFGYGAGIQFNLANNSVTSVNNGLLSTNEGCSSISDEYGNLLFYTDGTFVWNKNHDLMMNGAGLFGNNSSTQSAIIVPKPDDKDIYYIFTVDFSFNPIEDPDNGFNYSIVDMKLDNGLGAITQKNANLLQHCSEKITAVLKDCITKSIWVITFASENGDEEYYNTFHAFEVSNLGVSNASVKSTFPIGILDKRGYLKISPDGTKLAAAHIIDGMQVFDFDASTGQVSNQLDLTINSNQSPYPYGVEFSPNSELLYVHAFNNFFDRENPENNNNPANHSSVLAQFNMIAPDIQASQIILDDRNLYRGGLQLGPNGKIYRALCATYDIGSPFLGVINNPNNLGVACNYQHNAISLSPNNSTQGLPPFIASFFNKQIDIIKNGKSSTNLDLCDGDTYKLTSLDLPGATYTWTLDEVPLTETDYDLEVTQSGHYEVYIDPNNGECAIEGDAFVLFNPNPAANNHTILQCDEDGIKDGFTLFNLNEAETELKGIDKNSSVKFYIDTARTQEVEGSSFANTTNPQTIYVEVINEKTTCFSYSELTLEVSVTDSNDTSVEVCDDDGTEDGIYTFNLKDFDSEVVMGLPTGLSIAYYGTYDDALLEQNDLGGTFTNTIPYSQIIFARVENANNCYGISEVLLTINQLPNIDTEELAYYCLNKFPETISINAGLLNDLPSNYTYNWSSGENTYLIDVNEIGNYQVTITNNNGCSKTRTITIEASNIATIDDIQVKDASQNNVITIITSGEGEYQYQLLDENNMIYSDYQDSNVFENVLAGIYSVVVKDIKNDCGTTLPEKLSVIGFPKFLTPNNDGHNDTWQVYGVSSMFQPNTKIQIFDRYGKLVKELNPLGEGWDGSLNGERLPSDDYWFLIELQDGRLFRNHFTLKN